LIHSISNILQQKDKEKRRAREEALKEAKPERRKRNVIIHTPKLYTHPRYSLLISYVLAQARPTMIYIH